MAVRDRYFVLRMNESSPEILDLMFQRDPKVSNELESVVRFDFGKVDRNVFAGILDNVGSIYF